ncbi:hypothetical protein GCM10011411_17320 [Aurantiacibacter arachoides]|nr:hypothetical protein GCM10011411_17320 [Aurantiacibacter arachoides]
MRDGVEAWSRGDYAAAVAQWQAPAAAGDPDAMFNLGQAYRLGRGVVQDNARAEDLYRRAAQAGHVQAADTWGLMMFQDGRREQALPYVEAAARRGDPRAQYLIGIAHFNGDLVPLDWERAYALMTLANASGLPQAAPALVQMDTHIPIEQRQAGAALARSLEDEALAARQAELAAADLAVEGGVPRAGGSVSAPTLANAPAPRADQTVTVSPSVAAARAAVEQARQATGTASPAEAGASFANAAPVTIAPTPRPEPAPARVARIPDAATAVVSAPVPAATQRSGPWRVQLGAFGVAGNAERLWARVASRPEVAGRERLLLPTGRVTRLQAAGYASQGDAQAACNGLRRAGFECLVTRN